MLDNVLNDSWSFPHDSVGGRFSSQALFGYLALALHICLVVNKGKPEQLMTHLSASINRKINEAKIVLYHFP